MKNKILSIILAVLFILTIAPIHAFADSLEEVLPEQLMAYLYDEGLWSKEAGESTYTANYYSNDNKWVIEIDTPGTKKKGTLTYYPDRQSMDVSLTDYSGKYDDNLDIVFGGSNQNNYENGHISFNGDYYYVDTTVNTWAYNQGGGFVYYRSDSEQKKRETHNYKTGDWDKTIEFVNPWDNIEWYDWEAADTVLWGIFSGYYWDKLWGANDFELSMKYNRQPVYVQPRAGLTYHAVKKHETTGRAQKTEDGKFEFPMVQSISIDSGGHKCWFDENDGTMFKASTSITPGNVIYLHFDNEGNYLTATTNYGNQTTEIGDLVDDKYAKLGWNDTKSVMAKIYSGYYDDPYEVPGYGVGSNGKWINILGYGPSAFKGIGINAVLNPSAIIKYINSEVSAGNLSREEAAELATDLLGKVMRAKAGVNNIPNENYTKLPEKPYIYNYNHRKYHKNWRFMNIVELQ